MQIFIKTLGGETKVVQILEGQTTSECLQWVSEVENVDADLLNLVSGGSILSENDILSEKLIDEQTVWVTLGLDGGKKKKKRKPHTTPKKNKHKHQPIKLHTLKFYSVDNALNVKQTRKSCPDCPPGYFMAKHFDRYSCGRCKMLLRLDQAAIAANLAEIAKRPKQTKEEKAAEGKGGKGKAGGKAGGKAAGKKK